MKPFLLIAGYTCYPSAGTKDWRGAYYTRKEAEFAFNTLKNSKEEPYEIQWYEIVDLREWMEK